MKRLTMICMSLTILAGCSSSPPQVCPGPVEDCCPSNELDYSTWPAVTPKPIIVHPAAFADCAAPDPDPQVDRGPHFSPAIKVYANPVAHAALLSGDNKPMPVGAVVVKEKLDDEKATKPHAYGAMIKRQPGYDPEHGDWEYVYVRLGEKGSSERGKIASCIGCHSSQSAKDYLFRAYIDKPAQQK